MVYNEIVTTFDGAGNVTSGTARLLVRSLAGGAPSVWSTSPKPFIDVEYFASDPMDGGLLAYESDSSPTNELEYGNQSASSTTLVATQPNASYLAWDPGGEELVDVDSTTQSQAGTDGFSAGLWLFFGHSDRELLVDPKPPTSYGVGTFSHPVFMGENEIVFQADNNLWEIPRSCNMCTFPKNAKQLTTDGTSARADEDPAWTSQTITPLGGNPVPPKTKLKLTVTVSSTQNVLKHKGLVLHAECNLSCAIGAGARVRIKGTRQPFSTKTVAVLAKAKRSVTISLSLSRAALAAIKKALSHHTEVTAEIVAEGERGSTLVPVTRTFRIRS